MNFGDGATVGEVTKSNIIITREERRKWAAVGGGRGADVAVVP